MEILALLLLLQIKHYVLDSNLMQPTYVWDGKVTYGQWGGIQHAGVNALGTLFCFLIFASPGTSLIAFIVDFITHYNIDWLKGNFIRIAGIFHDNMGIYLTYADQALHQIVYFGLTFVLL